MFSPRIPTTAGSAGPVDSLAAEEIRRWSADQLQEFAKARVYANQLIFEQFAAPNIYGTTFLD